MKTRPFGSTGIHVPVIGQGTWYLDESPRAVDALRAGIEAGMTHIDTAEMYGSGAAERAVGAAIAGQRERTFVVSKVLPHNADRSGTVAACERSLRHLGTDYIDCYLLHWPGSHPLEETFAAFDELKKHGKIRSYGVSNFDVDDLEELTRIISPDDIACNQVLYHPSERTIENRVLPWCTAHGIAVVAYSPFGHGALHAPGSTAKKNKGDTVLAQIAQAHGVSVFQVALAFVTRMPNLFAIPKAASLAHLNDNAAADELALSANEMKRLEETLPTTASSTRLPML